MIPSKLLNQRISSSTFVSRSSAEANLSSFSRNRATLLLIALVALLLLYPSRWTSTSANSGFEGTSIPAARFENTPMCDPQSGLCGEESTQPSPRTIYSTKTKEQYHLWWQAHAKLKRSAKLFEQSRRHSSKPPLILLGDSITESWLGTNMGRPEERAQNIPKILQDEFADQYDTLVLAIGGDQVQHLHWRLQHGELLHAARNNAEATFCILIGTNNIGSGMLPEHTVHGIIHFIDYMLEEVEGRLLVMKLLPRGDSFRLVNLCPPRCNNNGEPFASFTPAIRKVNQGIDDMVKARFKENKRIKLVDCGGAFEIENGDNEVNEILMPDKLHPNAKGHEKIAACIKNHLYSSSRGGD